MLPIMKFKFVNLLKNALLCKENVKSTMKKLKRSTESVKPFIMKTKCLNQDFLKWISA